MRQILMIAAVAALTGSTAFTPAFAEDRPVTKAPTKTLGDEGKLPPTSTVTGKVPDMRGPDVDSSAQGTADGVGTAPGATPPKRMGDEGKLPATNSMTKQTPEMRGQQDK